MTDENILPSSPGEAVNTANTLIAKYQWNWILTQQTPPKRKSHHTKRIEQPTLKPNKTALFPT